MKKASRPVSCPAEQARQGYHPWWLLRLLCCDGDHEHYGHILFKAKSLEDRGRQVRELASSEYGCGAGGGMGGGKYNEDTGGYEFEGGGIAVYVDKVARVKTEQEFEILKKYLGGT